MAAAVESEERNRRKYLAHNLWNKVRIAVNVVKPLLISVFSPL